jgi:hypothetical protein
MAEADSHLKLLPTSILDMHKVFEHIDMLSIGIWQQPYTVILTLLGADFWVLGHCHRPLGVPGKEEQINVVLFVKES